MLPDGEFRVGKVGASLVLGYSRNYLTELEKKSPKQLKALQGAGYTGLEEFVTLDSVKGGGNKASTLGLQDFRKLIIHAASKGKPEAISLLNAIVDVGLDDWFRLSFDITTLTLEEKRNKFYQTFSETMNWIKEDRKEWDAIAEQERFLKLGE